MKRRSGLQEEEEDDDDDDDNGKDNMNMERSASRPQLPSTGEERSTRKTKAIKNVDEETKNGTKMKATTASHVDVMNVNDYCKNEKGIVSTETSQNTNNNINNNNNKITRRTIPKNEQDASNDNDDDKNSIASDDSISDRPGAFAIQGRQVNTNDTMEDGIVPYSTTEEVETDTHNQQEEAEAGKPTIHDPLEAERVLETVQGISITLDDQNDSPRKWKQLTIILSIFVFVLCTVAAVLIAFFVKSNRNDNQSIPPPSASTPPVVATVASPSPTDLPTFVPSTIPSAAPTSVQQQIITVLLEYFADLPASNDQQQALDWIITDPTSLGVIIEDEGMTSSDKRRLLLERFVLATIYFATNGIGWQNNNLWLSSLFVCQWYGVNCRSDGTVEQRKVNYIDLNNNQLIGSIPTSVGWMTSMTWLRLSKNALTGSIPTQLGFMTSMTWLDLSDNALSGSIATELGSMTSMELLALLDNNLSGSIPTELGLMTNMLYLYLDANILTGSIPTEVGLLTRLKGFGLASNSNLTGTIPSDVVTILPNLEFCFLGNTSLIDIPENCQSFR